MIRDPIVEEVRELRRRTEAACDGDWDKLVEHFRQVQKRSGLPVTRGSPRRLVQQPRNERDEETGGMRPS